MMKPTSIEEAQKVIEEFPDVDEFVNANFRIFLSRYGDADDNSIELAYYWKECKRLLDLVPKDLNNE